MLNIDLVISRLEALTAPSRPVDGQIATLIGYEKRTVDIEDQETGQTRTHVQWASPSGECPSPVPAYTGNLDAAFDLARAIAPGIAGGCGWDQDRGRAVLDGIENCHAATAAIALCVAALKFKRRDC